ncbi:alpha/beta hydrolase [Mycolicibacterium phocaicum]|uniref:Alpha/beta hydrolase n=1 Tax=Mycolicibacterium phocaicum TaxID=319706 RepID=A0A7I7ZLE7_9MYCO|nr:alpha/beta hydrolase [Mycolicibacterium phocaicum]TLH69774.1 alpha/beta hydrolase [Mycolicibacterium phocaicum]BBZ54602.1 alpha/beta hydrolase [Mycolicibacterium phocaicum]
MSTITAREQAEIDRANASTAQPVVFVHGLWLLPNSWNDWRTYFEEQGFVTLAPGWPDDPSTTAEARRDPSVFARKSVGQVTEHYADVIRGLDRKPIIIGHSFGGLITQKLAGLGLAKVAVAIDPAPFRGVLPLPLSALRAAFPVLKNPRNRGRAIALTPKQFRFGFGNAVSEEESNSLYEKYSVAGPGVPLFQAALANFNPRTEAKVDTKNPDRGPLLIISGEKDNTVPPAIANASYKQYKKNPNTTEIVEIAGRGHSLVVDGGWKEVADSALDFVRRF